MLQVDENIGGRHDQKNNGLRTKTWAVGLLIVLGCFVVGYFGATTTTTTATRMSSPNGDGMVVLPEGAWAAKEGIVATVDGHSTTRSRRYDFAAGENAVVTEDGSSLHEFITRRVTKKYGKKTTKPLVAVPVAESVPLSLLETVPEPVPKPVPQPYGFVSYPVVSITNTAPFTMIASIKLKYLFAPFCGGVVTAYELIASGDAWSASSRGLCLVIQIDATLTIPDIDVRVKCTPYKSSGTAYAKYSIIMRGAQNRPDGCCVRSSNQSQECPKPAGWVVCKNDRGETTFCYIDDEN